MDELPNTEFRVIEYELNRTRIDALAAHLSTASAIRTAKHWFFVSEDNVKQLFTSLLHMANIVNNRKYRLAAGHTDSGYLHVLEAYDQIEIPRYVRDVIREVTRPMIDGQDIYIPKTGSIGSVMNYMESRCSFHFIPYDIQRIKSALKDTPTEFVSMVQENLEPLPFLGWTGDRVYSVSQPKQFRAEAMATMQWALFKPLTVESKSEQVSNSLAPVFASINRLVGVLTHDGFGKIMINGTSVFSYSYSPQPIATFAISNERFPTQEVHSVTPRASRSGKGNDKR